MPYTPENLRALAWVRNGSKPSAPVDVLAVMDSCTDELEKQPGCYYTDAAKLQEARAAIAELIAAAKHAHMALIGYLPAHRNAVTDEAIAKVSAALARVGGGL